MEIKRKRVLLAEHFLQLLNDAGGEPEETLHMGIAAVVRMVTPARSFVTVMDPEWKTKELFGENCILDCKEAERDGLILYAEDGTEKEPREITLADLREDDEIFVTLWESEVKKIGKGIPKVRQIQLGTQRLNEENKVSEEELSS